MRTQILLMFVSLSLAACATTTRSQRTAATEKKVQPPSEEAPDVHDVRANI